MVENGIGASPKRKEDFRFITGRGTYVDDIDRPGQAFGYFLRSPMAHARIASVDTEEAQAAPGVLAVLTGADIKQLGLGGLICGWMVKSKDGSPMKAGEHPVLAHDKVRYVGDHVAFVVAETYAQAKDAAELIDVDYEELAPIVDLRRARGDGEALVHDGVERNTVFEWELGEKASTEAAFARASKVVEIDLVNNRLVPNAMEPRAAVGDFDQATQGYTLYTTSQNPHVARLVISAFVGVAPEHQLRVVAPDVGGGFGSKIFIYAEECVCLVAAKRVGRPVKWTGERSESFLADAHGRDHVTHAAMALDENANFLALRVHTTANMGAYLSTFASSIPTYLYGTLLAGQYKTPAIYCEVDAVYTNTAPVDAYRGAGRPEATYLLESLVDKAGVETGLGPVEIRRRNFIPADAFPYQTPVALQYDTGNYGAHLDEALKLIDFEGFPQRRADSERRGKRRGIGISCYIEACGIAPSQVVGSLGAGVGLWESAKVQFNVTGSVTVFTGTHSHGQSHVTTFSQVVAEKLGVPFEQVNVVHGDTSNTPMGMGTYGSRSLAVGGSAIVKACDKLVEKGKRIAAHLMEADVGDIAFENGSFTVAGTDKSKTMAEIVFAAYVPHNYPAGLEPGMEENAFYDPLNFTYPAGTHIAEVEIDPETGETDIVNFVAVDDFGKVINPMVVEGQVHGGLAQGIGQALLENCVYDLESGQLLSGSYMDYCMPRADDLPSFTVGMTETACTHNPLGVKGCGEAGAIGSPPAIMNAVRDAVGAWMDMPATPLKVWQALERQKQPVAAE